MAVLHDRVATTGRRPKGLPLAAALLLAIALCGGAALSRPASRPATRFPGGVPAEARGADLAFYGIADRYLEELFRAYPTSATRVGYHAHDGRLEDLSASGRKAKLELARRYRAELAAVDPKRLSVSARIDHGLVLNDVEDAIFTLTELKPYERDPQSYVDLLGNATLYLILQPPGDPAWPDRLASLLSRMQSIPRFLEDMKANLRNPPRVLTELVIHTNRGNIDFFESTAPPLFSRAPALARPLNDAAAASVSALKDFQRWLETDLLPRSKGDWRLGRDLWTKKLRHTLQSSIAPGEILERARDSLGSTRRRMLEIATPLHASLFPDHAHAETGEARINVVVKEVLAEVTKRHATRDTFFAATRAAVDRVKAFIRAKNVIGLPPETDTLVIEPTPGFMDGVAVAFFNPPPVLEPDLKKSFWISSVPRGETPDKDREVEESFFREYNDYNLQGLSIHEAFPGHYVQHWYALRSPLATVYKKIFASGTFEEGWGVLAEEEMFDAGYAQDEPGNLLVHLKQSLRAPMNAILDATLHTTAMPDEEADRFALDLMRNQGFQEEAEARGKLRRAKVTATQLSTYFVGYLELSDILNEARRREGAGFDLRAFNERLLSFGAIPPKDVRALMPEGRDDYEADIEAWRQKRQARLLADDGWLTVSGLFWLKEGPNRVGTDRASDIVLPQGSAPGRVGVFELKDRTITFQAESGAAVTRAGKPITTMDLKSDETGDPDVLEVADLSMFVIKRGGRYAIRLRDKNARARREFTGLSWFPAQPTYRVTASFVPYEPPRTIPIPNVLGEVEEMPCPGYVSFRIGGHDLRLEPVLEEPGATELFYIFRDLTSGKESYPGGRFLYSEMPRAGSVVLDFNKAYTPPCAFTPYATCPLPPRQNWLDVRIEAGEKTYGHHGTPPAPSQP